MGRFTHLRFINSKKLSNTQSMRFRKYVFWNFADQFGQCTRKKMRVGVCVCVRASECDVGCDGKRCDLFFT